MPTLETVADAHARRQRLLAQRTAAQIAQLWSRVDPGSIAASWRQLLPLALIALTSSQTTAAAGAGTYVDDALEAQGVTAPAVGLLSQSAFAGVASDGRDLASLLYRPAVSTLIAVRDGHPLDRARAVGGLSLDVITRTQVADAGRAAEAVSIASRPRVAGYVRMLSQPSCSRCIILAGKRYRWNAGFRRHPRCDCRHIPAAEDTADDLRTDPKKAFESMVAAEQERIFGAAGAKAIREGADINQVVNASRSTYVAAGRKYTRDSTTRSGVGPRVRLMPEQIFIEAKGNRDEAIRLLRFHGYLR